MENSKGSEAARKAWDTRRRNAELQPVGSSEKSPKPRSNPKLTESSGKGWSRATDGSLLYQGERLIGPEHELSKPYKKLSSKLREVYERGSEELRSKLLPRPNAPQRSDDPEQALAFKSAYDLELDRVNKHNHRLTQELIEHFIVEAAPLLRGLGIDDLSGLGYAHSQAYLNYHKGGVLSGQHHTLKMIYWGISQSNRTFYEKHQLN